MRSQNREYHRGPHETTESLAPINGKLDATYGDVIEEAVTMWQTYWMVVLDHWNKCVCLFYYFSQVEDVLVRNPNCGSWTEISEGA